MSTAKLIGLIDFSKTVISKNRPFQTGNRLIGIAKKMIIDKKKKNNILYTIKVINVHAKCVL